MSNIEYRKIPWLTQVLDNMRANNTRAMTRVINQQTACDNRKYHIASARLTALILLGGTADKTLTWSAPFDDTNYAIEFVLLDLDGFATLSEVSRTTSTITVRATAGIGQVALGSVFIVFGRSL